VRNSLLVEWFCAENVTGLKPSTEAAEECRWRRVGRPDGLPRETTLIPAIPFPITAPLVGERSAVGRRQTVRTAGRRGSANAGMSSEKKSENLFRRKPKVS
jgi:hypothetical protein